MSHAQRSFDPLELTGTMKIRIYIDYTLLWFYSITSKLHHKHFIKHIFTCLGCFEYKHKLLKFNPHNDGYTFFFHFRGCIKTFTQSVQKISKLASKLFTFEYHSILIYSLMYTDMVLIIIWFSFFLDYKLVQNGFQ